MFSEAPVEPPSDGVCQAAEEADTAGSAVQVVDVVVGGAGKLGEDIVAADKPDDERELRNSDHACWVGIIEHARKV